MRDVVEETVLLFKDAAREKSISLVNKTPPGASIHADKHMLHTILRNLTSNAIKFSRPGDSVTISARITPQGTSISVCDTGVGMPPEVLDSLFAVGESRSTVGTWKEKGTGLGLLLCREFIDTQGGSVEVHSKEGNGTTIAFWLPQPPEKQ